MKRNKMFGLVKMIINNPAIIKKIATKESINN